MVTGDKDRNSQLLNKKAAQLNTQDGKSEQFRSCVTSQYSVQSTPLVENVVPLNHISPIGSKDSEHLLALSHPRVDHANNLPFVDGSQLIRKPNDLSLGLEDLVIPWKDLDLREKIGAGIYFLILEEKFCAFPLQMNFSQRVMYFIISIHCSLCSRHTNSLLGKFRFFWDCISC